MIRQAFRFARERWKLTLATLGILLVVGAVVFVTGVTAWEYTNSTEFCGLTCHTMPPEYVAYESSPHARVPCVDCHLGQDSVLEAIPPLGLLLDVEGTLLFADIEGSADEAVLYTLASTFGTDSPQEQARRAALIAAAQHAAGA